MFEPGREGSEMHEEPWAPVRKVAELYNLLFGQDDDRDYEVELTEDQDDEGAFESLLRHAPEIEAA